MRIDDIVTRQPPRRDFSARLCAKMMRRGDLMDPQQGPPQPDLLIGQTIGNYLVTQKLGEGGMGSVYLAEHPQIGKKVALKVLHSEFSANEEVDRALLQRGQGGQRHRPPEHRRHHRLRRDPGGAGGEQLVYFIMEYLPGGTLTQLIRAEAPLAPERALGDRDAGRRRAGRVPHAPASSTATSSPTTSS